MDTFSISPEKDEGNGLSPSPFIYLAESAAPNIEAAFSLRVVELKKLSGG